MSKAPKEVFIVPPSLGQLGTFNLQPGDLLVLPSQPFFPLTIIVASTIFYPPNEKQALLLPHPTHSEPSDMSPTPHSASAEVRYHLVVASVNTEVAAQSPSLPSTSEGLNPGQANQVLDQRLNAQHECADHIYISHTTESFLVSWKEMLWLGINV